MKFSRIHIVAVLFGFFSGILIIYFYFNRDIVNLSLQRYKLVPEKEQFTELYLNNHLTLPGVLEPDKIATASFTIRNNEYKTEDYTYLVTQEDENEKKIISSGAAQLKHNQQQSIVFSYSVASAEAKTKIEILLPEKQQRIHFWINNTYGR